MFIPDIPESVQLYVAFAATYTVTSGIFAFVDLCLYKYSNFVKSTKISYYRDDFDKKEYNNEDKIINVYKHATIPVMKNVWLYSLVSVPFMEYYWNPVPFQSYIVSGCTALTTMFLTEIPFYFAHRLFHHKYIRHFHAVHHENTDTLVAIVALYAHPVDYLMTNLLPVLIIPIAFHCDKVSTYIHVLLGTINTIISHVEFFNLRVHGIHHINRSVNFGYGMYMDKLFRTEAID